MMKSYSEFLLEAQEDEIIWKELQVLRQRLGQVAPDSVAAKKIQMDIDARERALQRIRKGVSVATPATSDEQERRRLYPSTFGSVKDTFSARFPGPRPREATPEAQPETPPEAQPQAQPEPEKEGGSAEKKRVFSLAQGFEKNILAFVEKLYARGLQKTEGRNIQVPKGKSLLNFLSFIQDTDNTDGRQVVVSQKSNLGEQHEVSLFDDAGQPRLIPTRSFNSENYQQALRMILSPSRVPVLVCRDVNSPEDPMFILDGHRRWLARLIIETVKRADAKAKGSPYEPERAPIILIHADIKMIQGLAEKWASRNPELTPTKVAQPPAEKAKQLPQAFMVPKGSQIDIQLFDPEREYDPDYKGEQMRTVRIPRDLLFDKSEMLTDPDPFQVGRFTFQRMAQQNDKPYLVTYEVPVRSVHSNLTGKWAPVQSFK